MDANWLLFLVAGYFLILLGIGWFTGRKTDEHTVHLGARKTAWYIIGLGMVADALSGVTFISIPGEVGNSGFLYLQVVLGYILGYLFIAEVLIPLYFRAGLTSIYGWLEQRFHLSARRTGAVLFLVSRLIGASARLLLAVAVFQKFFLDQLGIPLWFTVSVMILLMLTYTYRGGIKTLIWTDAFQAIVMIGAMVVTIALVAYQTPVAFQEVLAGGHGAWSGKWVDWVPSSGSFFLKQLFGGALIALTMTGLDQSMMQKSLSCKNPGEAKTNLRYFGFILLIINFLFLMLGAYLYAYAAYQEVPLPEVNGKIQTDLVFPMLAFKVLSPAVMVLFTFGLLAATFSSADSVLTTMTTSFCMDFLQMEKMPWSSARKRRIRGLVLIGLAILVLLTILVLDRLNNASIIQLVLTLAGYTYGPLLGIFGFGMLTRKTANGLWFALAALSGPIFAHILKWFLMTYFNYQTGYELLGINAGFTFLILFSFGRHKQSIGEKANFT